MSFLGISMWAPSELAVSSISSLVSLIYTWERHFHQPSMCTCWMSHLQGNMTQWCNQEQKGSPSQGHWPDQRPNKAGFQTGWRFPPALAMVFSGSEWQLKPEIRRCYLFKTWQLQETQLKKVLYLVNVKYLLTFTVRQFQIWHHLLSLFASAPIHPKKVF